MYEEIIEFLNENHIQYKHIFYNCIDGWFFDNDIHWESFAVNEIDQGINILFVNGEEKYYPILAQIKPIIGLVVFVLGDELK